MAENNTQHVVPALQKGAGFQTCSTCKWLQPGDDFVSTPGICLKLGNKPVDLTIMTKDEVEAAHNMIGSPCTSYNAAGTPSPPAIRHKVALPLLLDPAMTGNLDTYKMKSVQNCQECVFYIHPEKIHHLGFDPRYGMCAVKGEILDSDHLDLIAQSCGSRQRATTGRNYEVLRAWSPDMLNNELNMFSWYDRDRVNQHLSTMGVQKITCLPDGFDPQVYETPDVTPGIRRKYGIKGWIKITDPSGTGNSTRLPSFDPEFFSETERAKIPKTGDSEHPESYVDHLGAVFDVAVGWTQFDATPTLWGAPGTGKTELARHLAWIMGLPFERINITDSTQLDDIQGYMQFVDGQTSYKMGRFPKAWMKPCVTLVDEPNVGPKAVWQFFRPIMDDSSMLAIDADQGEQIPRDQFCFLMMAMNPAWDIRNDGTNDLADADVRRQYHIELQHPDRETETKIIQAHLLEDDWNIPDDLMNKVLDVGARLRDLVVESNLPISWGIGQQIKVARYLRWFSPIKAYNRAAGDYLEPALREIFLQEVRNAFDAH